MSTTTLRWRITLIALAGILLSGGILIALLALGLADPPHAGPLRWRADSPENWPIMINSGELLTYLAPVDLPAAFTLELTALNTGPFDSAWGLALEGSEASWIFLIDNQGYISVSEDDKPHWTEFLHVHPIERNRLYINVEQDGRATLRINDEIAWQGNIHAVQWAVADYHQPALHWSSLVLYAK